MDPFSALGLAGDIITFVDFTWKLLLGAKEIYRSQSGCTDDTATIEIIAKDVRGLHQAIRVSQQCPPDLEPLMHKSQSVANDLLDVLSKLKTAGTTTSRWRSFQAALSEVWSRDKIKELEHRLTSLQVQTNAHIQFLLSNQMSSVLKTLQQIEKDNAAMGMDMQRVLDLQMSLRETLHANNAVHLKDVEAYGLIHKAEQHSGLELLAEAVKSLDRRAQTFTADQSFLKSFYFVTIYGRHERIDDAHAQTFEWIFAGTHPDVPHRLGLADWLATGTGVFWVKGKAGSGKSTFMKFFAHHQTTRTLLETWSRHRNASGLMIATYFFWHNGTKLQKTLGGLLRTIIFDILRQSPDLVECARGPSFMVDPVYHESIDAWSISRLKAVLNNILATASDVAFCLIIDGLDELEQDERTDLRELLQWLEEVSSSPNVKVCVSSRPWTVFSDVFKEGSEHTITMEELTRGDIRQYVSDKFEQHNQYTRLLCRDLAYKTLVDEVSRRAQGVFLWVQLVVRDLLDGFTHHDSTSTLLRRLEQFPEDLDGFFKHMLDGIPKVYRRQAARTFIITRKSPSPMSLLAHYFVEELDGDPECYAGESYTDLPESEITLLHEKMARQIEGQTKGLIEVVVSKDYLPRVDFLHRSVRDFLETTPSLWDRDLLERTGDHGVASLSPSDIGVTVCKAFVAVRKVFFSFGVNQIWREVLGQFAAFAKASLQAHPLVISHLTQLMNEFGWKWTIRFRTGQIYASDSNAVVATLLEKDLIVLVRQLGITTNDAIDIVGSILLGASVDVGDADRLRQVLELMSPQAASSLRPVINDFLEYIYSDDLAGCVDATVRVVRVLVQQGVDPDLEFSMRMTGHSTTLRKITHEKFTPEQYDWVLGDVGLGLIKVKEGRRRRDRMKLRFKRVFA